MLDATEARTVQSSFGVSAEQVRKDHLISHVLAAVSGIGDDDITFFGGTALARTHLIDLRLSEDIDLIAMGHRGKTAGTVQSTVSRSLRHSFGSTTLAPDMRSGKDPVPTVMTTSNIRIQIQLLSSVGHPPWPTEVMDIEQRYSDALQLVSE